MTKELSLFDVMTNISNVKMASSADVKDNMYNAIDWDSIKEQVTKLEAKKDKINKVYSPHFQELISDIIIENFNLERGSIYNEKTTSLKQLLLKIPNKIR